MPPLPEGIEVASIVTQLNRKGYIVNGRWSAFKRDPSTNPADEDVVFRGIESIVRAIQTCVDSKLDLDPMLSFRCNPDMASSSSARPDNKTKPDAYGILAVHEPGDEERPGWIDIAVPGEFKKNPANDQDVDVSSSP